MPAALFDDAAIARLRLAAEEVAWLTGRGYALDAVSALVAAHHHLSDAEQTALSRGTCSEPQYRRRAARELEPEDVARRPLAVDALDVLPTIEAAIAGKPILQTLDGTVRAFDADRASYQPGVHADEAIDALLSVARGLRPQVLRFVIDDAALGASELETRIAARAKVAKAKAEIVRVPSAAEALRRERQVASGDAAVLDACAGWVNLGGLVVATIPGVMPLELQ